ncbi:IS701 family transposase [Singulisphaera acidiphila]|uniref:Transposase family protein n=1 Tax=Singulisphaera acidiphila (strain ATCC BAA-1392 / DSM 18658 / VKM B-2454 / MOB10) TaxID=886293 RepID=L0DPA0_SINAD|nr:transposase [Singulisphaera acidiphila]AGA31199.1 transposase family protein [Singulisphaera acidiphila DSM 18658]
MDQLILGLAALVEAFRDVFHPQVFSTFQTLIAGWIVCLGPHTISEVWQATGLAARRHHDTAYAVFHSACWEWDDLGIVLATLILTHLVPGGVVWVAVDDTLYHKRGAKVAFGGIFLDAVMSSKGHQTFRFGLNWGVLGIAVPIPMRADRYYCLPVLWRLFRKKGQPGYQTRPQSAAALARKLAQANPERTFWLVGDSAYVNAAVLRDRPANLQVIGPLHWKAALYERPAPRQPKQRGASRKKGDRLLNPKAMIEDTTTYPAELLTIDFPKGARELRVQVIRDVLWYKGSKTDPVMVVLVRDPLGQWRDEALVSTDTTVSAAFVILGYCRRWSVELAFFDSKQFLGLHDPRVRSVQRAHPMAWFVGSLTILWYCVKGHEGSHVERERPWYEDRVMPTFTDMLGALRLQMWEFKVYGESGEELPSPECIRKLLRKLSAVA